MSSFVFISGTLRCSNHSSKYTKNIWKLTLISGFLLAVKLVKAIDLFYRMAKKVKDPAVKSVSDEFIRKLGVRIRSLREQQGYANYEKFANAKDINRTQYGRYEKGEDLQFSSLVRVVKAFDMTLKEFFSEGFD